MLLGILNSYGVKAEDGSFDIYKIRKQLIRYKPSSSATSLDVVSQNSLARLSN